MVLIKPGTIQLALDSFNSFHEILRFAVDRFENEMLDFLNIKMSSQCLTVYRKTTQTGQYVHYDSFVPWHYNISWIRSLATGTKRICSVNYCQKK